MMSRTCREYDLEARLISRGPGINLRLSGGKVFSACSFKEECFGGIFPSDKRRRVSCKKSDTREHLILLRT